MRVEEYDWQQVRALLDAQGMSIRRLAQELDVSEDTLYKIAAGVNPFRKVNALAIAGVLKVNVKQLEAKETASA